MLRCIDRDYEAASGEELEDGSEPVFIARRDTGRDVLRIHLKIESRVMTGVLQEADEGLSLDDVVVLFVRTYLGTLTDDFHRDRVDWVVLTGSRGGPGARFPYPSREVLFG